MHLTPTSVPVRVADTEAYDDLCLMVARREMSREEFSRRVKELEHERRTPDRH